MHHAAKTEQPSDDDEGGILCWDEYMVEGDDMIDESLETKEEPKEEACTFC